MYRGRILLGISLIVAALTPAAYGASPPLAISISGPSAPVKVGEPIRIAVTETNTSNLTLLSSDAGEAGDGEMIFHVEVRDERGNSVEKTSYGIALYGKDGTGIPHGISSRSFHIDPGDILKKNIIVTNLFKINAPGSYSILVFDPISAIYGGGVANSNIITIRVTE
jgi:hypothetical protein